MRGIVGLVLGLGVTLVFLASGGGGCKKENAAYCCTAATCTTIVECPSDGGHMVCDDTGAHGEAHACILDPTLPDGGGACEQMSDCTDPGTPYCVGQACVQCEGANGCSAEEPVCGAANSCLGCGSESDCQDAYPDSPHCGSGGRCVVCRTSALDCDAASTTPVCTSDGSACRACQADDECATGLCDEALGSCVAPADIIFVAGGAVGGAGCGTAAKPCKTIMEGVGAVVPPDRIWIQVAAGSYPENLALDGKKVRIVGAPLDTDEKPVVKVQSATFSAPCVLVSGNADVTLERLELRGGIGSTSSDGVRCTLGAGVDAPRLTLRDLLVNMNAGQGVDVTGCNVTIARSTVASNVAGGVFASDSTLAISRTRIEGNSGGGVSLTNSDFALVNNFIVDNGGPSSTIGGVLLNGNPLSGAAGAQFEFNTLSVNNTSNGFSSGVRCEVATTLNFRNNIVYANKADVDASIGQVKGASCRWTFSDIGPNGPAVPGMGNINLDPTFKDTAAGDYHLTAASLAKDVAQDSPVLEDFDGQTRPVGPKFDMGADEYKPAP